MVQEILVHPQIITSGTDIRCLTFRIIENYFSEYDHQCHTKSLMMRSMSSSSQNFSNIKPGFRPGISTKNGKLYAFSSTRIIVIKGWPELAAWTKTFQKPQWSRFRPRLCIETGNLDAVRSRHRSRPGDCSDATIGSNHSAPRQPSNDPEMIALNLSLDRMEQEMQRVRDYFNPVPTEVRTAIAPFPNRQWHLMVMAARCPESLEMLASNPALAYSLASCWTFTNRPSKEGTRQIRSLIQKRRRTICQVLGFPESAESILRKIPASACSISWLLTLKELLKDSDWQKMMRHLPCLNPNVLTFLGYQSFRQRITSTLLQELARIQSDSITGQMRDLLRMERQLGSRSRERFQSIQQIQNCHDQWSEKINRNEMKPFYEFPPPPIQGNKEIIPLHSTECLIEEGRLQANCVRSYPGNVATGSIYFYKILNPERATLSITRNAIGRWQLKEISGYANAPVSKTTRQFALDWISQHHEN